MNAQKLKIPNNFKWSAVNLDKCVCRCLFPVFYGWLFHFIHIEGQIVFLAPRDQAAHLIIIVLSVLYWLFSKGTK